MRPGLRPPAAAEALLRFALPPDPFTDGILGDLHEEFARISTSRSRIRSHSWYWIEAIRLASRYATRHRQIASRPSGRTHGDSLMRTILLDTRYAWRGLITRPAPTAIIVLTLALGLGSNAAIFSIIDALVIRPFTFTDIDRIAFVAESSPGAEFTRQETAAPANFLDWRRQADTFERLAAFGWWDVNVMGRDEPERVQGFFVSPGFFSIVGVQPALGRAFTDDEETLGRHRRAVLGYGLWQRRFAGDPGIVGQSITLDGETYDVIGIAPQGFDFPTGAEIWAPLAFHPETAALRTSHYLTVLGRLAPGRTLEDASAQMAVIAARLEQQYPEANRARGARVMSLAQGMLDPGLGPVLALWQASALFVLLIACANVANLQLARGTERQRDLAIRLAMGASRGRVVRELLIEAMLLALAAVPAAVLVSGASLNLIRGYMPARLIKFVPGWHAVDIDGRLILVTTALAIATAIVFGLLPALQAVRPRLVDTLKDGGRGATSGGRNRLRRILVVAEITLALPLLVASGMGALGAYRFLNGPQGFEPRGVLSMQIVLPDATYPDEKARLTFARAVLDRVSALPGVDAAAAVNVIPAHGGNSSRAIEIEGIPNPDPTNPPVVDYRSATPETLNVLRVPILKGRDITEADREDSQLVAVVSQSLATRHWPDTDAIGRRIRIGTGPWMTVVGISGDVIHNWFARRNYPTLYRPYAQAPTGSMSLVLRTAGDPAALAQPARAALAAVDPAQPVFDVMTMQSLVSERTIGLQYIAAIMAVFGGLALALAAVGVYGVMAYLIVQRTHEIGVRIALGATRRDVLRMAFGQTGKLTAIGVFLGMILSIVLGRVMEAGLAGSATSDPRIVAGFATVLILAAMGAGYVPARRAATIDPIQALRMD